MKKKDLNLFASAFLQAFFLAANTYSIAQMIWLGIAICSFAISWIWASNIKQIAICNVLDKLIYALGATLGGITSLLIYQLLI